jgi:hypothetical protein
MKFAFSLFAVMLLALVLASGCVQQPAPGNGNQTNQSNANPQPNPSPAPAGLKTGDWSRVEVATTSATPVEFTYISVLVEINGAQYTGMETQTVSGSSMVVWENGKLSNDTSVKMFSLTKFGTIVLCNALTHEPQNLLGNEDPYAKGGDGITSLGTGSFTTKTGKTVAMNKYFVQSGGISGEFWYSNQVPFALVKSETNTTVTGKLITAKTELQDFGSGATSAFASKDFEKCA